MFFRVSTKLVALKKINYNVFLMKYVRMIKK
jgi:hypothetical protein